jgi:AcrR family transcriptional regulator
MNERAGSKPLALDNLWSWRRTIRGVADEVRQSGAETRRQIIEAATGLLEERGAAGLKVSAIMQHAGVTRTTFYRQFDDVYGVAAAILGAIASELADGAGAWFNDVNAVGSREVIYSNTLRAGRNIKPVITLLGAIVDATALDTALRTLWHETILQPRSDASAAAIRRDQAAGVVPSHIDPDSTALALTLMGERLALEVLGRRDGSPEEYALILAPIWESVLFGHAGQD